MVDSVQWAIVSSENDVIQFKVQGEDGTVREVGVTAPLRDVDTEWNRLTWWQKLWERPPLRAVGLQGKSTPLIGDIIKNSPAEEAGLKKGDFIETVNDEEVIHPAEINRIIDANPEAALKLGIRRGPKREGEPLSHVSVTPRTPVEGSKQPMLGLEWEFARRARTRLSITCDTGVR